MILLSRTKIAPLSAIISIRSKKSAKSSHKTIHYNSKKIADLESQVEELQRLANYDINENSDYQKLIEKCWLPEPKDRPTFEEIVFHLKTNTEFITDKIDEEEISLGDRKNLLFSSSLITYGRGKGIVVETGMNTEVGKIASMINETEDEATPLQIKLNNLGKTLGIVALAICALIFVVGLLYGKEPIHMFMTAVSLAVAAIPEGLAAVSTIVLAIGVQRMVKRNAIVKKLPAVETLGSASVICSDKTGTLTQNKMTVLKFFVNGKLYDMEEMNELDETGTKVLEACMLCNDTKIGEDGTLTGDPTETALVDMGFKLKATQDIYTKMPRVKEIPFDSDRK